MNWVFIIPLLAIVAISGCTTGTPAEPVIDEITPSVSVSDQKIDANMVTVAQVVSPGSGWLVIHADNNGAPGTVLGQSAVSKGTSTNVIVTIDMDQQTPTLHAMLHVDAGIIGTYEFPGDDVPTKLDDKVVNVPFAVTTPIIPSVSVSAQEVNVDMVIVAQVVSPGAGWIVIHADNEGAPGTVLGQSAVTEGTSTDVSVTIDTSQQTPTLHAMLHVDAGVVGTYEFPGDDVPTKLDDKVVNVPFEVTIASI